jgi:hypothetical protein
MGIARFKFVERNSRSVLLTASLMLAAVAPVEVYSAPLVMVAAIQEDAGFRPDCPSQFGGTITGSGVATLLGNVSLAGSDCITPLENSFAFDGTMTFTVTSGDALFADYHGLFTPTALPTVFRFTNSFFDVTGGTGRFVDASGGGKLQGFEDIATGAGVILATGSLFNFSNGQTGRKREGRPPHEMASLNNSLFSGNQTTIGDYFYRDQTGQLQAVTALPESGSLSLLGLGLISLAAVRRRKEKAP